MPLIIDTSDIFKKTQSGDISIRDYCKVFLARVFDTLQPYYFNDISFSKDIRCLEILCIDIHTSEEQLRTQFDDLMKSISNFFDEHKIKLHV